MRIATRVFLLTALAVAALPPTSPVKAQSRDAATPVAEADMPVVPARVFAQGLNGVHRLNRFPKNLIFTSLYASDTAAWPRIELVYSRAEPGFDFQRPPGPDKLLDLFDYLRTRENRLDIPRTLQTRWGPIRYRGFRSDGVPCVSFTSFWSGGALGGGAQLLGYYCADPSQLFDDSDIAGFLEGLDIREALPVKVTVDTDGSKLPIRVRWPSDPAQGGEGVMVLERTGGGSLMFDVGNRRCEGYWAHEAGAYGEVDPPSGSWRVFCSDGKSVAGSYFSTDPKSAQATGYDDAGEAVFFNLDLR